MKTIERDESRKNDLAKKMGAYSLAAGAGALAFSGAAEAAPVIYDTQATPIDVHSDFFAYGANMAVIDPTVMTMSTGSAGNTQGLPVGTASEAGLAGFIDGSPAGGNYGDGINVNNPPDSAITSNSIFWRYSVFSDHTGNAKSGTEFGVLTGPGNGVYGFIDGFSAQPGGPGHQYFLESEIVGDDDPLLTGDTNPVPGFGGHPTHDLPYPATVVGLDGHGANGSGWGWDIVQGEKYLGFKINDKNGFVKVFENGGRNQFQILGWGIETSPFVPIHADLNAIPPTFDIIPEPSTLALLVMGAGGLLAIRGARRRRRES